ncbi:MAG TPA: hypothetical protein VJ792_06695 [Candidatus Nitrosotalea sp.]|nr:hypothetical protein [Candidatus Nitrosotalea sp.]
MKAKLVTGDYDPTKVRYALDRLLINRSNEFREIAYAIGYPASQPRWEEFILRFCLEFDDCFKMWSDKEGNFDHNKVHKCMTMMRQMSVGKQNMTEVTKLQNAAYRIAEDFKILYHRLK